MSYSRERIDIVHGADVGRDAAVSVEALQARIRTEHSSCVVEHQQFYSEPLRANPSTDCVGLF